MGLSVNLEGSHKFSFNSPLKFMFRLLIRPENLVEVSGFHYLILLDVSLSMSGEKIEVAKAGLREAISKIPPGNRVTLITFSNTVDVKVKASDPASVQAAIEDIKVEGRTALYTALKEALRVYEELKLPGKLVLVTDGMPTDVTETALYSSLHFPPDLKFIAIGVGNDYNGPLLTALAQASNGLFQHVENAGQLMDLMPTTLETAVGAKRVSVDFHSPGKVTLVNYSGPPLTMGTLEGVDRVFGWVEVQPNFSGEVLKVRVEYEEPLTGERRSQGASLRLEPAPDPQTFLSGLNRDLIAEFRYYEVLRDLQQATLSQDWLQVTRRVDQLREAAEATRRIDLIEATRRIEEFQQTRRSDKEILSETTRRLRGKEGTTASSPE